MRVESFDHLLEMTFYEVSMEEVDSYPTLAELNKYKVSEEYEQAIMRIVNRYRKRTMLTNILRVGRNAAAIFMIVLGLFSVTVYSFSSEVRAACNDYIISFYNDFLEYLFPESSVREAFVFPDEVEEYRVLDVIEGRDKILLLYGNGESEMIVTCFYNLDEFAIKVDTENYDVAEINICGYSGLEYCGIEKDAENQISLVYRNCVLRTRSSDSVEVMKIFLENLLKTVTK